MSRATVRHVCPSCGAPRTQRGDRPAQCSPCRAKHGGPPTDEHALPPGRWTTGLTRRFIPDPAKREGTAA